MARHPVSGLQGISSYVILLGTVLTTAGLCCRKLRPVKQSRRCVLSWSAHLPRAVRLPWAAKCRDWSAAAATVLRGQPRSMPCSL